jgi:hypothetical protein
MRKIKKINGYLVVKFNDRELREWDGTALGNYGVIDAELYTGCLDVDRGAMEYDGAETLDEAVELARGLESEEDIPEEEPSYTVSKETNNDFTEEEVFPQMLIHGWQTELEAQVRSRHHKDVDPRTAAHALYGFKTALNWLGLLDDDDTFVLPDTFGEAWAPLPKEPEELLTYVCDEVCKQRVPGRAQEELDAICEKCALERLADEADDRELHRRSRAQRELNDLINELRATPLCTKAERLEQEARAYLRALDATRAITEREVFSFKTAIDEAVENRPEPPKREVFEHLPTDIKQSAITRKVYSMGEALEAECPENDCRVYLNIFRMAREVDSAIDGVEGHAAQALIYELSRQFRELRRMYVENYAIQQYREGMQS